MKECKKVKFASIQAIKDHLKHLKGSGDASPYFCHTCNAYHYTSYKTKQDYKIEKLIDEIDRLRKENQDLRSFKGIPQIDNTLNMVRMAKQINNIDSETLVLVKCDLIQRLYSMIDGPNPKLFKTKYYKQFNEPIQKETATQRSPSDLSYQP